tara:strand:- start:253 stop:522 length:270 start_codon:yes stop_codon:yes gene_type:complete
MTKKNQLTYVSLLVFFLILVGLGTLNKTQEPIVYYDIVDSTIIIPDLPAMDGTPTMALNQLPMLIELPKIAAVEDTELPHLTLPPLQDF